MKHPPQRMSQNPDPFRTPPGAGTVTYDVTGATLPLELVLRGAPCGTKQTIVITGVEDATFPVDYPAGCTGAIIEDQSGQSMDFALSIQP